MKLFGSQIQKISKRYPRFFSFLYKRIDPNSFFGLPLTLISISFLCALFLFIIILQSVLVSGQIVEADYRIAQFFVSLRNPGLVKTFFWISLLGKWQIILAFALVVSIALLIWKQKDYFIYLWIGLGFDEFFNYLIKNIVRRPRPSNPAYLKDSFSFPSGHATISIVFYGFLAYLLVRYFKKWGQKSSVLFVWLILVVAIGFSRIYLGVHCLSDIWAGYLVGFLVLITTITLYEARQRLKSKKSKSQIQSRIGGNSISNQKECR